MSRAIRRHHSKRIYAKRLSEATRNVVGHPEWAKRNALRRVNTGCLCSCHMCANARSNHGNGKWSRTLAEIRSADSMKDQLLD